MSDRDQRRIEAEISKGGSSTDPFASAVKATRMPMIITDPHQDDNPIIFVNDAFCRLTGYDRDELIGRNCRFLQGPQTNPADVSLIREAIRERRPIELELLNHKKSGEVFWNKLLISPVFDDAGELTFFFASQFDITFERTTRSEFHIKSQEFEALAENVSHLAWMAAPDGNIFWYNRRWYDYTGYDLDTMKGWGWRAVHRPFRYASRMARPYGAKAGLLRYPIHERRLRLNRRTIRPLNSDNVRAITPRHSHIKSKGR